MAKKDYKSYLSTEDKDRKENLLIICNKLQIYKAIPCSKYLGAK